MKQVQEQKEILSKQLKIKQSTYDRLTREGRMDDTYDKVINDLLDDREELRRLKEIGTGSSSSKGGGGKGRAGKGGDGGGVN